jgi:glycosyltransferase involved in cell wall biosynthesis
MRIGFLTPEFVTERYFSGGMANYVYRISRALVSRGHEVRVITFSEEKPAEFDYKGIGVCRINNNQKMVSWLNRLSFSKRRSSMKLLALSWEFYKKLKELHLRYPFDLVQYSNYNSGGLVSSLLLDVPYVLRISTYTPVWHECLGVKRTPDMRTVEWMERLQLRVSRNIYAPSTTLKRMLEEQTSARNVGVVRTPFFIETESWDSSLYEKELQGKAYLLFFGRFQLHKGIHILAQALPRFFKNNDGCSAVCVGLDLATPLAPSMRDYVSASCGEYANRLIFLGQIPHEQLYPVISGARLVVLPSLIDNLPNACLEAMALGKPVVGTRGASFEEMIRDGETGFLVPAGDAGALADTLCSAWREPRLDEIGRAAAAAVQAYAPEETVQAFLDYAEGIISRRRTGRQARRSRAEELCARRHSV